MRGVGRCRCIICCQLIPVLERGPTTSDQPKIAEGCLAHLVPAWWLCRRAASAGVGGAVHAAQRHRRMCASEPLLRTLAPNPSTRLSCRLTCGGRQHLFPTAVAASLQLPHCYMNVIKFSTKMSTSPPPDLGYVGYFMAASGASLATGALLLSNRPQVTGRCIRLTRSFASVFSNASKLCEARSYRPPCTLSAGRWRFDLYGFRCCSASLVDPSGLSSPAPTSPLETCRQDVWLAGQLGAAGVGGCVPEIGARFCRRLPPLARHPQGDVHVFSLFNPPVTRFVSLCGMCGGGPRQML